MAQSTELYSRYISIYHNCSISSKMTQHKYHYFKARTLATMNHTDNRRGSSPTPDVSLPAYHSNNNVAPPAAAYIRDGLGLRSKEPAPSILSRASSFLRRHTPQTRQQHAPANANGALYRSPHVGDNPGEPYLTISVMMVLAAVGAAVFLIFTHPAVATKDCLAKAGLPAEKQTRHMCDVWPLIASATLGILTAKAADRCIRAQFVHLAQGQYYTSSKLAGLRDSSGVLYRY